LFRALKQYTLSFIENQLHEGFYMQKVFVLVTLLSMHNVQCFDTILDFVRTKNVINVDLLNPEQKKEFVPLYQKYCTQQFQKAASSFKWRGIPAAVVGAAAVYCGTSSLGKAGASAMQGANKISSTAGAISYLPVCFALDSRSWLGVGLICVAAACFVYAGWKLMPVISRFIKSRSFYINRLNGFERGFDGAVRKKMSYPTVSCHGGALWHVKWANSNTIYDFLDTKTMKNIFNGASKSVQEILVPRAHRK
jgi:hypothetical protein